MHVRSDQVAAQKHQLDRLTSALVHGDPDALEAPHRRYVRALFGGCVLALVALLGVAAWAAFSSNGSTAWQQPGTLILDEDSGSRFVLLDGRLRPVLNVASARLILGDRWHVVAVSGTTLRDVPRGAPIGIPGAPDEVPQPADRVVWQACAASEGVSLLIGGQALPITEPADAGVLVTDGSQRWLLLDGVRHQLSAVGSQALGADDLTPSPVPTAWLNLLPTGDPLAAPSVPASTETVRVGAALIPVGTPVQAEQSQYTVVPGGLEPLTTLQWLLVRADTKSPAPVQISLADAATAPKILLQLRRPPASLPADPPHVIAPKPGQAPCLEVTPAKQIGHVTLAFAPARAAGIEVRGGCLVAPAPVDPRTGAGAVLVTAEGRTYPVGGGDALRALGLDVGRVAVVPPPLLALLPRGPALVWSVSA